MGVQIGGLLCALTERHRDMKLSGFEDLIKVDVIGHVKDPSDLNEILNFELEEK